MKKEEKKPLEINETKENNTTIKKTTLSDETSMS